MISVAEALTRLESRLQAPFGTFWSEQEGIYALTEALRVWQCLTGAIVGAVQLVVAPGQTWVASPGQLLTVSRVLTFPGTPSTPLWQWSTTELDQAFDDWEGTTGVPTYWAPEGTALFAIYPAPTVTTTIVLEGPLDIALLNAGTILRVGDEELTRILNYAQTPYLSFKEAPQELATESLKDLVEAAMDKNQRLRNSAFYKSYAGRDRVIAENQEGETRIGEPSVGAR